MSESKLTLTDKFEHHLDVREIHTVLILGVSKKDKATACIII